MLAVTRKRTGIDIKLTGTAASIKRRAACAQSSDEEEKVRKFHIVLARGMDFNLSTLSSFEKTICFILTTDDIRNRNY